MANTLDKQISNIINNAVNQITSLVVETAKEEERARLLDTLQAPQKKGGKKKSSGGKGSYVRPKVCKTEGCTNPNKGPRFGFLCEGCYAARETAATNSLPDTTETDQPAEALA
jgi:hypothetical protein